MNQIRRCLVLFGFALALTGWSTGSAAWNKGAAHVKVEQREGPSDAAVFEASNKTLIEAYEKMGQEAKARKLRKSFSSSKGSFLGFNPAGDLGRFAVQLRNLGREAEAKEMEVLAQWWTKCNMAAFLGDMAAFLEQRCE